MFTHLMRRWLSRLQLEMMGKPRRRRLSRGSGSSESLEPRVVLVASATAGATALISSADNSAATARDLGVIGASPTTVSDFVGNADTQDYFRFNVAEPRMLSVNLGGMSSDADLQLLNSQGVVIASSTWGGATMDHIDQAVAAGNYFVRVYQYSGDTNYDLTLSAT